MLLDIPIQHQYEVILNTDNNKKMEVIMNVANQIEKELKNLNIQVIKEKNEEFKPKNKWGRFALRHSSLDSDKLGDTDLGEIIRSNHDEFKKGFNF
jgi:hypothetical protein